MTTKNQKLWGGRFAAETLAEVDAFNASISFDFRLYPYDIQNSIAHAKMLAKQKIISASESKKITQGLQKILKKIESGDWQWSLSKEDVHLNIESVLTDMIGPAGAKLHTARSRNDQVATDIRLYCRDHLAKIRALLRKYQKGLTDLAEKNVETIVPGYTHLQRAQPISLGHHLLAYVEMAERDVGRLDDLLKRVNVLPLGSGALAGTTFPIDREFVARELGFTSVAHNSLDAVSDRDFVIEFLSALSLIQVHLSRLAEEWILWTTQEFQFIQLPQQFCTGSSMMPQKVNPDVMELIRGKTGRVFGSLQALLVTLKGLPLAYNKDMQEDKEPLFDAVQTVSDCLNMLVMMIPQVGFHEEKMKKALDEGFVLATDLADYLASRGVPFREAHHIVGRIVAEGQKRRMELKDFTLEELQKIHPQFQKEVFDWLDEGHAVDRRSALGGTARANVRREIKRVRKLIQK